MTRTNNFEFKVFITNLALYNDCILHGDYVDFVNLSIDEIWDEINRICYNPNSYEPDKIDEFFITDYEASINCDQFGEYEDIENLKNFVDFYADFCDKYGDSAEYIIDAVDQHTNDRQELMDILEGENFRIYSECYTMTDVAYEICDELGYLDEMPEHLRNYFDYESFGRDLNMEGNFYYTSNGVYVEIY